MPTLHVQLLDTFLVTNGTQVVSTLQHTRLQELLAYLLLNRHRPQSRQQLAFLFWPDSTEKQARTNLRTLLYRLRTALPDADRFLGIDAHTVQWQPDAPLSLDVAVFEDHLHQVAGADARQQLHHLQQAVALYEGDLLPDCYSDWLLVERARVQQAYARALEQLAILYEERRDYPAAIAHAEHLLQQNPIHEAGYRQLMRLHALDNDRGRALRVYHRCVSALQRELGAEPSPATQAAYRRLLEMVQVPPSPQATPAHTRLIGRHDAWQQLLSCWRALASGHRPAQFILITGEAGVGKTRLAEEFVEWARRQGATVATARAFSATRELAYGPVAEWLHACSVEDLPEVWRREVARLRPDIDGREADEQSEPLREAWQRVRFFEALARVILAQSPPIVLLLDDIQWCGEETIAWLEYLCRYDERAKLCIVATCRSEALTPQHPVRRLLAGSRHRLDIDLDRLSETETAELVTALNGHEIESALAHTVYAHSEGNPLFVVELVRGRLDGIEATSAPLTNKMQTILQWRLERLSPDARRLMELAAVIGREFTFRLLAEAGDVEERRLVECLDESWQRRVIREQGNDAYDFSHDKLRETAYVLLGRTRRRWLHGQVAHAIERLHAADLDSVSGQLGRHFAAAGHPDTAINYYRRAARTARDLYALDEAAAYWRHALDLLPRADLPPDTGATLYERLGEVLELIGAHEDARTAFQAALDVLPETSTFRQAQLHRLIGDSWVRQDRLEDALAAHEAARRILGDAPADDAADWWHERIEVGLAQANSLYFAARLADMQRVCKALRAPVERFGSPRQRANFYSMWNNLNNRRQRFRPSAEAVEYERYALEIAQQLNDPPMINHKTFKLGFQLLWNGELNAATAYLSEALSQAETQGNLYLQDQCLAYLTIAHRRQGNEDTVQTYAEQALTVATSQHNPIYIGVARANLAWLAYRAGDFDVAVSGAEQALKQWQGLAYPMHWLAHWPLVAIAVRRDDVETAVVHAAGMLGDYQQWLPARIFRALQAAVTSSEDTDSSAVLTHLEDALRVASELGYL